MATFVPLCLDSNQLFLGCQIEFAVIQRETGDKIKPLFARLAIHMLHYGLGVSVEEVKVVILIEVGIEGDAEQTVLQSGKNLNFTNYKTNYKNSLILGQQLENPLEVLYLFRMKNFYFFL